MNLAQARSCVGILEVASAHPVDADLLDDGYQPCPVVRVEPTDHAGGVDLEVTLAFYATGWVKWPTSLYLSSDGSWSVWDAEANLPLPVTRFEWRKRQRPAYGWAFCAVDADDHVLTPYLPEEHDD